MATISIDDDHIDIGKARKWAGRQHAGAGSVTTTLDSPPIHSVVFFCRNAAGIPASLMSHLSVKLHL